MRLVLLLLLLITSNCYAANYYVAANGNDNNDGSINSPFQTLIKATSTTSGMSGGDTLFFRRGDVFLGTFKCFNSGNANARITITSYGTGALPIITSMQDLPLSSVANWELSTLPNVWRLKLTEEHYFDYTPRIKINNQEYQRAKDSSSVTAFKRTSFHNIAQGQFIYMYATSNPSTLYTSIKTANVVTSQFDIQSVSYLTVSALDIRGAQGATVEMANNYYVTIRGNIIGLDGNRQGIRAANCHFIDIQNNVFDTGERIKQDFNFPYEGGDGINVSRGSSDINIGNNKFYNWRHVGLSLEQFYISPNNVNNDNLPLVNIHAHHNYYTSKDIDYGRAVSAYFNNSSNVVIENETMEDLRSRNQFAANGLIFRNSTIDLVRNSDYDSTSQPFGIGINVVEHAHFVATNMLFENLLIKNCETAGISVTGGYNNTFRGITFQNNGHKTGQVYWSIKDTSDPNFYPSNLDIHIADNVNVEGVNNYIDNVFYRNATDKPVYYGYHRTKTVQQFNALNGDLDNTMQRNKLHTPLKLRGIINFF